jgi:hypothetical protein
MMFYADTPHLSRGKMAYIYEVLAIKKLLKHGF